MTRKEIWNGYKGWILTTIIGGTLTFAVYIGTLIIQDTDWYHQEEELIDWYDGKSHSYSVGLRVNDVLDPDTGEPVVNKVTGEVKTKLVYKAPDGESYRAIYSKKGGYYYYVDDEGKNKECH
jgi:hypothetical protein